MNNADVRIWIIIIAIGAYFIGWLRGRRAERDKWELKMNATKKQDASTKLTDEAKNVRALPKGFQFVFGAILLVTVVIIYLVSVVWNP